MDDITESVAAAFEQEEKQTEEKEQVQEQVADSKTEPESKPVEDGEQGADNKSGVGEQDKEPEQQDADNQQPLIAPKQLKREFARDMWEKLDVDTKNELIRLSSENERNFARAAEAEHNAKQFRKTIEPVQGYIAETAQSANIPESEVIRNCVSIMQALNDSPTLTARQMIAGRMIQFDDPVAVINEIAHTYGLNVKSEQQERNIPEALQSNAAMARYQARQAKFVKPSEPDPTIEQSIQDYITNTPGIQSILDNPDTSDRFIRQIDMERKADPMASDITIINRAAELFEYAIAPKAIPTTQPAPAPVQNKVQEKLSKVVSPKASNPVDQEPVKKEPLTPEQSVRETLRSMGLDD